MISPQASFGILAARVLDQLLDDRRGQAADAARMGRAMARRTPPPVHARPRGRPPSRRGRGSYVPADRYFQPPSGSSATIVPWSSDPGHARRGDQHRARRRPREDALLRDEVAQRGDGVAIRDEELPVEERRVEDLGHEPFVERAQPLDVLAGQRFGGVDRGPPACARAGSARRPSACPPVPRPATNASISGQSARISGPVVS